MERTLVHRICLPPERAQYTRACMESAFPAGAVGGYEAVSASMPVNEKDRHVLAAALVGHAQLIVTNNVKDFPQTTLEPMGIRAKTADTFLNDLLARYRNEMLDVLHFMTENTGKAGKPELSLYNVVQNIGATAPNFAASALVVYNIA